MKRILLILGEFVFLENEDGTPKEAIILTVTETLYVDEEKASDIGEVMISNNVVDGYLIPKLYKGKITFNT